MTDLAQLLYLCSDYNYVHLMPTYIHERTITICAYHSYKLRI